MFSCVLLAQNNTESVKAVATHVVQSAQAEAQAAKAETERTKFEAVNAVQAANAYQQETARTEMQPSVGLLQPDPYLR